MVKITRIEVQKRNPRRRSIFLDGEYAFGLDEEVFFTYNLQVGDELSQERIGDLRGTEERHRAKDIALRLLGYRARSCREVEEKLREKGIGDSIIDEVISCLKEVNLLNDVEFARTWVAHRMRKKPMGKRLLRAELRQKGVAPQVVDEAIEEVFDRKGEVQVAIELLKERKSRHRAVDEGKGRRRMAEFLARRGFSPEVIGEALRDAAVSSLFPSNAELNGSM